MVGEYPQDLTDGYRCGTKGNREYRREHEESHE